MPATDPADPPPPSGATLAATLAARVQALAAKARRAGGRLGPDDQAEVQALAQLQQLLALQRPPRAPRWPLALVLVAALAATSLLMARRVPATPVELEIEATALRFELSRPQALTGTLALASLRAVGVQGGDVAGAGQPVVLVAGAGTDPACHASLTLEPLLLPAGARVTLRAGAQPARLRLALLAPGATLRLSQAECPAGAPRQARSLDLHLGTDEADLELEAAAAPLVLAPVIAAQGLALDEVETLVDDQATRVRRASTLRTGRLHLLALDGAPLELRRGELLTLGDARGELRELEAGPGALKGRFAGDVRSLQRGEGEHARNLMPTLLEWLRANQALALVWGSGLTLFGLALAVGRWWRGARSEA